MDFQLRQQTAFDVDTIKSDCMWSSTLTTDINTMMTTDINTMMATQERHRHLRRDVSLTLSECAEGVITSIAMSDLQGKDPSPVILL